VTGQVPPIPAGLCGVAGCTYTARHDGAHTWEPLMVSRAAAEAALVEHQRVSISSCSCGWSRFGRSWPAHVVEQMVSAR
jgi:hypothetical protein